MAHPRRDLGDVLAKLGRHAEAADQYRAALRASPDDLAAWHALGLSLAEHGDFAGAEHAFRRATWLDPGAAASWSNLGMMLKIAGRFDEAIAAHDRAVALAPDAAQIRLNRAIALLHMGRMAEAWGDYEARLLVNHRARMLPGEMLPRVDDIDLTGRTVLVWHEEGFGDTIQFCRYVPALAARGARVLLAVPSPPVRLMRSLSGAEVFDTRAPVPPYDFHCPAFSLPRAFGTTLETIPGEAPYLAADPALVADWAQRLPRHGLRVGVVWAGQARPWLPGFATVNARRSLDPEALRCLHEIAGVQLVSLQLGHDGPDFMLHPMRQVSDFADTAAVIANLDLVISVDTSVLHLAGALGKPVLLLDRVDNCWRWLTGREGSPWYPTLRILRQERVGDWTGPLRRAKVILQGWGRR